MRQDQAASGAERGAIIIVVLRTRSIFCLFVCANNTYKRYKHTQLHTHKDRDKHIHTLAHSFTLSQAAHTLESTSLEQIIKSFLHGRIHTQFVAAVCAQKAARGVVRGGWGRGGQA